MNTALKEWWRDADAIESVGRRGRFLCPQPKDEGAWGVAFVASGKMGEIQLVLPCRKFAFTDELKEYAEFMESERRLSSFTVRTRLYQTGRFLRWFSKRPPKTTVIFNFPEGCRWIFCRDGRWDTPLFSLSSLEPTLRQSSNRNSATRTQYFSERRLPDFVAAMQTVPAGR